MREHEATVSRQLARARGVVREAVERELRTKHGMDDRTVAECLRAAAEDARTGRLC
jgi:hypothetical protein